MLICDLKVSSEQKKEWNESVGNDLKNHQHLENVSTLFLISLKLRGKTMNNFHFFFLLITSFSFFILHELTEHINNSCFDKRIKLMPFFGKTTKQKFFSGWWNVKGEDGMEWGFLNQKFIIFLLFQKIYLQKYSPKSMTAWYVKWASINPFIIKKKYSDLLVI